MAILELARDVIDFCYPGICAACRASADPRKTLCSHCLDALATLESAAACPQCAMPVAELGAPCPFCEGKGIANYESVFRLGIFEDPLKQLIHLLKYQRRWAAGELLAERLLAQAPIRALIQAADVLVPVPLHPLRHFTRGYNQAAIVARVIARRHRKPIARPLSRIRHTESQTNLRSRQKRIENLRGAFHLRSPKAIEGKRILVIDDVMTTGATLQAIARALKPAHPQCLDALLLAVADPKGRSFEVI
ncbi:MAG TPA: ComF family protein [Tepidisphaeraceae bacterium]